MVNWLQFLPQEEQYPHREDCVEEAALSLPGNSSPNGHGLKCHVGHLNPESSPRGSQPWEFPGSAGRYCAVRSSHVSAAKSTTGKTLTHGVHLCEKQVLFCSAENRFHIWSCLCDSSAKRWAQVWVTQVTVLCKRPRIAQSCNTPFPWVRCWAGQVGQVGQDCVAAGSVRWALLCQGLEENEHKGLMEGHPATHVEEES